MILMHVLSQYLMFMIIFMSHKYKNLFPGFTTYFKEMFNIARILFKNLVYITAFFLTYQSAEK